MGKIVQEVAEKSNFGTVEAMNEEQLKSYIATMRSEIALQGLDLSTLGVEGLSMETEL